MKSFSEELIEKGMEYARNLHSLAYAPYSKFHVSAALYLSEKKEFIGGVNVENMSFGGTICAERSAICSAVSKYGRTAFGFIIIYTRHKTLTPPCGICRQFISEFCDGDFPVILINHMNERRDMKFSELLPHPFESF